MENCGEYLQVLYGIWRAGMVAVPMNVRLHEKEIAFILANAVILGAVIALGVGIPFKRRRIGKARTSNDA